MITPITQPWATLLHIMFISDFKDKIYIMEKIKKTFIKLILICTKKFIVTTYPKFV